MRIFFSNRDYHFRVSKDDYGLVNPYKYKWLETSEGYAARDVGGRGSKNRVYLHRLIISRIEGRELLRTEYVDHINGDKSDNRRENLRLATPAENPNNKHAEPKGQVKFFGVSRVRRSTNYRAYYSVKGKQVHLGMYATKEEAAQAYNNAVSKRGHRIQRLNDVPLVTPPRLSTRLRQLRGCVRREVDG